ncbi:MAG TPA: CHAT domain-containing protein [Blastocatellia bacterium]|nr:CHAT domain-containing protein [Blastocatellia bacterium]HMX25044.1 CHAT domain-containing protein [Blastocatellia bacterium]HMZ16375.1 CHAT domain-containing protein [Blastocatellia bacterium]HNG28826.1 CHAT domain-containing protein [Blastocatellia bacterium]
MNWNLEEENKIRRYLLGDLPDEVKQQVEENLLQDDEYADWLLVIEDELVDDYERAGLPAEERQLFEQHFLTTPERRQKLLIARSAFHHVAAQTFGENTVKVESLKTASEQEPRFSNGLLSQQRQKGRSGWWTGMTLPAWHPAFSILLSISISVSALAWWYWQGHGKRAEHLNVSAVQEALNQAYRQQRPLEVRITGFAHAAFIAPAKTLGSKEAGDSGTQMGKVDNVALDRARVLLFGQDSKATGVSVLHLQGKYYLTQKDFDTAIEQLQQAVRLAPESAQLQSDLGAALLGKIERDRQTERGPRQADVNDCLLHLNEALRLTPDLPEALFNRALLQQRERLRREAKADWEHYLRLDAQSGWAEEARLNLNEIEATLNKVGLRKEQLYRQLLDAWSRQDADSALQAVSFSYSLNGNALVGKLLDEFLAAWSARDRNQAEERLQVLQYIGRLTLERQKDRFFSDVVGCYERATLEQLDLLAQARRLMVQADSLNQKAENDRAIEIYQQACQLFAQVGDRGEELFAVARIGHCHHQRSATQQNLQVFTELVPILAEKNYRWMLANALCGRANGHNSAGQFSQAIADCVQCGRVSAELGDQTGELRSQYILGGFYYQLGKYDENLRLALAGQHQADELAAGLPYVLPFYNLRAWSLSALGFQETAVACQREAVKIAEETRSLRLIAYAYIYQGRTYAKRGWFAEAVASAQHGINIGWKLGNDGTGQDFVHTGLLSLGHIQRSAGNFSDAIKSFDKVIDFYQHSKKQAYFYGAAKGRLLTLIAQKNNAAAREELDRVLALYERFRESIREESNRNSFFDQEQSTYDVAINFAYTVLNDPVQAYRYVELSRARSLLDEMEGGIEEIAGPQSPELLISMRARPTGVEEISRQIPTQVQLVEYAVLDDKLIIWLISKDDFVGRVVNISATELNETVGRYLSSLRQKPGKTDQRWREQAKNLYGLLVRPITDLLNQQKQVCVIPDKILTQLPFSTLISQDTGRLLLEDYLISYSSSANVFLELTARARSKESVIEEHLLSVGNPQFNQAAFPDLESVPATMEEAKRIAAHFRHHQILVAEQAKKAAVIRGMERADVVHLAMHYVPDPWSPMFSRLPLAADKKISDSGALHLHELYRLKLERLRLVVLAACQTRGEGYYNGEGAVGISRLFEAAGVPKVVASLWPVETEATSELMLAFHRLRKRMGKETAAALRGAQLELLNRVGDYHHPYYWAAFTISGGYSQF